jgi:hypothetical protein
VFVVHVQADWRQAEDERGERGQVPADARQTHLAKWSQRCEKLTSARELEGEGGALLRAERAAEEEALRALNGGMTEEEALALLLQQTARTEARTEDAKDEALALLLQQTAPISSLTQTRTVVGDAAAAGWERWEAGE